MVKLRGIRRSDKATRVLRIGIALYALLLAFQSLMFAMGILSHPKPSPNLALIYILTFGLIATAFICLLTTRRRPTMRFIQTFGVLIISTLLILATTGISAPFSLGLTLVLYDIYKTYKVNGLAIGTALLFGASVFDAATTFQDLSYNPITPILYIFSTVSITLMIVLIIRTQLVRQSILEHSVKQAELERYKIKTLINNLNHGVISIDQKGIINSYNAAALNILDTNESLNGKSLKTILKLVDEDRNQMPLFNFDEKTISGYVRDDVFIEYDKSGTDRAQLELTLSPISDGLSGASIQGLGIGGYIIQLRDITHQKSLDEEKDEFISVVSHELRTPIAVTEGVISNLIAMYDKGVANDENVRTPLKSAHNQIVYLAKMINDLSTLSRAERGVADEPEYIDVKQLVEDFYQKYQPIAEREGLALDISTSPSIGYIHQSHLYVSELIQNLLMNAIKYTHEGTVTLKATRYKGKVTFTIKDTGIGISASDKDNIFKKFFRSEDYRTRETRGTGLGLYVSGKLARKLGTEITLKSRLNHGSEFSFKLSTSDKPPAKT